MSHGKSIPQPSSSLHREDSVPAGPATALTGAATCKAAGRSSSTIDTLPIDKLPIDNPHELLGLVAGEENARVIIEAARSRLVRIREANGSEVAVRAYVIGQICRARAAMLKDARRAAAGRGRQGGQRSSGTAVESTAVGPRAQAVG